LTRAPSDAEAVVFDLVPEGGLGDLVGKQGSMNPADRVC
jgi:hypothetical protein